MKDHDLDRLVAMAEEATKVARLAHEISIRALALISLVQHVVADEAARRKAAAEQPEAPSGA